MTMIIGGVEMEPNWQGKPKHPIREVLKLLCGKAPPKFVVGYDYSNLTDNQHEALHNWCSYNARPYWSTGIALAEAAEKIVEEAVSNGNIPPKGSKWLR